jgi:hypothetical protein
LTDYDDMDTCGEVRTPTIIQMLISVALVR